ncbi:hypothetical protein BGW80DRAFT_37559 [Lactifluus volemus]|nr:hypothetical protein BGW80DRAFT_37559 [Lactifluus volemus]
MGDEQVLPSVPAIDRIFSMSHLARTCPVIHSIAPSHTPINSRTLIERLEQRPNQIIEDLEITNRSLLAINATLEGTKHRQAREIRELRRKLRASRLMLPPRAFRALKSSLGPEDVADDEDMDDDDDAEDGDERDEVYDRIKGILDNLLETGRRALRAEPGDFEKQGGGVKVLSAEEVRSWRGDIGDDRSRYILHPLTQNRTKKMARSGADQRLLKLRFPGVVMFPLEVKVGGK